MSIWDTPKKGTSIWDAPFAGSASSNAPKITATADVFGPTSQSTPSFSSSAPSLLDAGKGLLGVGMGVVQGFFRGTAAAGAAIAGIPGQISNLIQNKPAPIETFDPTMFGPEDTFLGQLGRNLYGTDKPIGFGTEGAILGAKEGSPLAIGIGGTLSALDLFGAGGAAKTTLKGLVTGLKVTEDAAEAARLLKAAGFAEDIADSAAGTFAKITDAKEIENGLFKLQDLQNTTKTGTAAQLGKAAAAAVKPTERGFVTSVKDFAPELIARVAGQYIPRDTDILATQARNLVRDNIDTAEKLARNGADDKAVATAAELIKHYTAEAAKAADKGIANALYDKAADIGNHIAAKLTEQGRSIQAASILGRLTPEGMVRFAAREIQKYNEGLKNATKRIPELTGEQTAMILKKSNEIANMPDGIEKSMAWHNLSNDIAALVPSTLYQKIIAVWKAGLLTGLKTSGLNVASNLFHGVSEVVKDVPAAAVDSVAALFTGKRTLALTTKGTAGGVIEGFKKGWRYLKTGFDERNVGAKLDYHKVNFGTSKVARGIQAYEEAVFRVIGAEDQPFYYGAKARSLASQALAIAKNVYGQGSKLSKAKGNAALPPELKSIEDEAFRQVAQKGEKGLVNDYIERFGKVVNTDNARELFPDYVADRSLSAGVHEPASDISKQVYTELLKRNKNVGDKTVLFTGGGTGAGKSTALEGLPALSQIEKKSSIVYDTNSNKVESAIGKVEEALKAGYDVRFVYVYRDPVEAFVNGTLPRAEKIGRTVPLDEHLATHTGIPDTALKLLEKYKDDPRVSISVIDNSKGLGKATLVEDPVEFLTKKVYNKADEERVRQNLTDALEGADKAGTISPRTYEGTSGRRSARDGAGDGRQSQQPRSQQQLVEDLIANPTDEMLKYATLDAETAVFQQSTVLGKVAKAVQNIPGGEVAVPFGRTPAGVATQLLNYSPVGIVKTIAENIGKGKFDQRLFSQGIGRGLVGTGAMYIGGKLLEKNMISLGYPPSEREREQWKIEGRTPNSILVDGKWRSVASLGPLGLTLVAGAYYKQGLEESGTLWGGLAQAASGGAKSLTEQTFLKGVSQVVDAINDPQRSAEGFISGLIGSAIPTIVSDAARSTDSSERRTPGILDRAKSRIPGLRETLEPQIGVLGKEKETESFLETMLDPTRPSTASKDPVVKELRRLGDAGFVSTPTLLGDKEGYPKALTPQQNTQLWIRAGGLLKDKLDKLIESPQYAQMDDEQKQKTIMTFTDTAKLIARAEMVVSLTTDMQGEELKNTLSKLKAGGLLTKEVLKKYAELR